MMFMCITLMPDYVVTVVDMMFVCITLMPDYVVAVVYYTDAY